MFDRSKFETYIDHDTDMCVISVVIDGIKENDNRII